MVILVETSQGPGEESMEDVVHHMLRPGDVPSKRLIWEMTLIEV